MSVYEVCITIVEPYKPEVRLPPIFSLSKASTLGRAAKTAYPGALIEIAHNGIRSVL